MIKNLTVNIGDSVYVDSNETFNVVKGAENWIDLVDLNGHKVAIFSNTEQILTYLGAMHNEIEVIKGGAKVENKTLTREDELKLAILFDVITSEVEYCFDLNYNSEKTWSVEERANSLIKAISERVKQTPKEITKDYGDDYFSDWIKGELKEVYRQYKTGDEVEVDGQQYKIIFLQGYERYGLLSLTSYEVEYASMKNSADGLIAELKALGSKVV